MIPACQRSLCMNGPAHVSCMHRDWHDLTCTLTKHLTVQVSPVAVQAKQNESKYTGVSSNDLGGGSGFGSKSSSSSLGEVWSWQCNTALTSQPTFEAVTAYTSDTSIL